MWTRDDLSQVVKLACIVSLLALLCFAWTLRDYGRYTLYPGDSQVRPTILDTRSGTVFMLLGGKDSPAQWVEMRPQTGEVFRRPVKP